MVPQTYLYTISRRDIPVSQQAVQAGHAALEYAYQYGRPPDNHPTYVHLTTNSRIALEYERQRLREAGIVTTEFHESYKNWGLTAIACLLTQDNREILSHLPLWRADGQTPNPPSILESSIVKRPASQNQKSVREIVQTI